MTMLPTDDDSISLSLIWAMIRDDPAKDENSRAVEITGWMIPPDLTAITVDYFSSPRKNSCCGGCVPRARSFTLH